jgi:hypothetical protein
MYISLAEQLSYEERILRRRNLYVDCLIDDQLPPFPTNDQMINYEIRNLLNFYAQKWNVTQDLLFVNLNRLFTILPQLTLQDFIIKNYELSIQEWFIILEFYLQMNGESSSLSSLIVIILYLYTLFFH